MGPRIEVIGGTTNTEVGQDLPTPREVLFAEGHTSAVDVLNALMPRATGEINWVKPQPGTKHFFFLESQRIGTKAFHDSTLVMLEATYRPGEKLTNKPAVKVTADLGPTVVTFDILVGN